VPTAADFAFGIEFDPDRALLAEDPKDTGVQYSFRRLAKLNQLPPVENVYEFNRATVSCLATQQWSAFSAASGQVGCLNLVFTSLPPNH